MELQPNGLPKQQGLYDPQFEKDACGVGFVANIDGVQSHKVRSITVIDIYLYVRLI